MERHDLYRPIHKALRLLQARTLTLIGVTDFSDEAAAARTLDVVRELLQTGAKHLEHEEAVIHPLLAARAPDAVILLEAQHGEHRAAFAEFFHLAGRIATADAPERPAQGRELYLALARFMAADFLHMAHEEQVIMPLLQRLFTDEELIAVEGEIVASIPPDELTVLLQAMLEALSRPERAQLMGGVRAGAPPGVFEQLMQATACEVLSDDDLIDLNRRLAA
ncbi:hemerythrin domain-containing protein [Phenylobacterium sp.]|jgi:hemerythrin-like domain-containing protein|uniref:hemerythrin domain-containing protein n=1 Tax=Phenylobacterium sp. TaxID=1871053 RepID=UPI002E3784EA|nr:hemerythrin domain-containing protein [Phenylobacterium sp.]HEX2559961.1 hemerythrin domain-containing protein [Phenylobacterium sp.]